MNQENRYTEVSTPSSSEANRYVLEVQRPIGPNDIGIVPGDINTAMDRAREIAREQACTVYIYRCSYAVEPVLQSPTEESTHE